MLQAQGVERADREDADAALGAAWAADQPVPAAPGGVGEGCVDNLDEALVGCG